MIAIYGLKFIIIGFVLSVVCTLWAASRDSSSLFIFAVILAVLTLFLTFFYRNPHRDVPQGNGLFLSIADGKVLSVEDIENEYIGGRGKKVSIFLSVFDAHINRIPVNGKVEYVEYTPGKFWPAFKKEASNENERAEIGLNYGSGKIIFRQIVGILARRIVCKLETNQEVKCGDIYGIIHFGSRAEIFLPEGVEIVVKAGDKVKAGETIIGRLIE